MQLIANGTQGPTTPPAKQTPVGTPGYAYGGPPGSTPATDLDPDVFNTVLAEQSALATATGNALDPANNAQMRGAVKTLAGSNATGVTSAGTTTLTASQAGLVEVNATAGNITINLPTPSVTGTVFRFEFLRVDATANTVTVVTPSGTIITEPTSAASILLPGSSLTRLICDSSNYIQDGPYALKSALAAYAALNGSASQVFNVANAVSSSQAVALGQISAPMQATAYGGGTNTTATVNVSFTAPSAGILFAVGAINKASQGASASATSLSINGTVVDSDNTELSNTNLGAVACTAGAVTASFSGGATTLFTLRVMLVFVPNL